MTPRRHPRLRHLLTTLGCLFIAAATASAQEIVGINLPAQLCIHQDTTLTVTYGPDTANTVVIQSQETTLGHSERIFLPDGRPCGNPSACTYRSPVTFTSFATGATVTSAEDIVHLRLNIEHSYAADIYIGITCPNGQHATIMRFGGTPNAICSDSIPSQAIGWTYSSHNASSSTYFGQPFDNEDRMHPCDSTRPDNAPGTGWNYCWSDNTTAGITYAPGDAIIYHRRPFGDAFDSSNVANLSNFYHPDDNLSNLIGCPLNGTWTIEVIDGYQSDNGYIFEWELALAPELLPQDCTPDQYSLLGPNTAPTNDTTFTITSPHNLATDTTILYTFRIINTCGDTIDTTATIHYIPTPHTHQRDTACDQYTLLDHTYTADTTLTTQHPSALGCDSLHSLHLTIHHSHDTTLHLQTVENNLPYTLGDITLPHPVADTTITLATTHQCDSTIHLSLTVYPNRTHTVDTALCQNQLPLHWNNRTYHQPATDTLLLATTHGADSTLILHLAVHPSYDTTLLDTICARQTYTLGSQTYTQHGTYTQHHLTATHQCDSNITLILTTLAQDLHAAINAIPTVASIQNPTVTLYDNSVHHQSHLWLLDGQTSKSNPITYTFNPTGNTDTLPVTLIAISPDGCADTTTLTITIDRSTLYTPNTFTPNQPTNNTWAPKHHQLLTLEIWIYTRQGLLVRHLEGLDAQWDGTSQDGTPMPQAAYAYTLLYTTIHAPKRKQRTTGTILLLR